MMVFCYLDLIKQNVLQYVNKNENEDNKAKRIFT